LLFRFLSLQSWGLSAQVCLMFMGKEELWLGDMAGKSQHRRAAEGGGTSEYHL